MKRISALAIAMTLALTGCVTTQGGGNMMQGNNYNNGNNGYNQSNTHYGRVTNVREYMTQKNDNNYLAIAGGALVGGILGNQVGGGTGKKLATVAGAGAGAYAANEYTKKPQNVTMVEIQIHDDNGQTYTINQEKNANYFNGMRVRVQMNGNTGTVTPN